MSETKLSIGIKRIYDEPASDDGYRILVDRIWPRGVSKEDAALSDWIKEVAPTSDLRKWFGHDPERFEEFRLRYRSELDDNPAVATLRTAIANTIRRSCSRSIWRRANRASSNVDPVFDLKERCPPPMMTGVIRDQHRPH